MGLIINKWLVNSYGILKKREKEIISCLDYGNKITRKAPQKCCLFTLSSDACPAHTKCKALCWANETADTLPADKPLRRTFLPQGQSTHGHGRAAGLGGVGSRGRRKPKFGLQSLGYPIFKVSRFLHLDHGRPMRKLGRRQVTRHSFPADVRAHVGGAKVDKPPWAGWMLWEAQPSPECLPGAKAC